MSEPAQQTAPKARRAPTCLVVGCGMLVAGAGMLSVLLWWGYHEVRDLAVAKGYSLLEQTLDQAELEPEQHRRILADLARLRDGVRSGEVSVSEAREFVESLSEGPFLPMAAVMAFDRLVLRPSALEEDEKLEGRIHLERIARALHEGRITHAEVKQLLRPLDQSRGEGEAQGEPDIRIERQPTPEELRALIAAAKAKADQLEVPVEPFEVDLAAEVHQAVDSAFE